MSFAESPSNPFDDLVARRVYAGSTIANGVMTEDLVRFCESGVSVVIASCNEDRRPVVGRGLACKIDQAGRVRLVVRNDSNIDLLRAVAQGRGLAVTFTKPSTHRSIQLKASFAWTAATGPSDGPLAMLQTTALKANLVEDGYWEALAAQYCAFESDGLAVIEFVPEHAFVQTPGPGAGTQLHP